MTENSPVDTVVAGVAPAARDPRIQVDCPGCGTPAWVDLAKRSAAEFCSSCDYPLFWALGRQALPPSDSSGDTGLRRLPGTAGRAALASLPCPACTEPNPPAAARCGRCGADLHPAPVVAEQEPEPLWEPEPAPPVVARRRWWPWVLAAALVVIAAAGWVYLVVWR